MSDSLMVPVDAPWPTDPVEVAGHVFGNRGPLFLIAGPCVIEDDTMPRLIARTIKEVADELGMPFVFKASYDKANRTSGTSFRGPGMAEGLQILRGVADEFSVPVLSDVHAPDQVPAAAEALDILQIPAFLCRQTDLLVAAGKSGRVVNVKKGQFVAPHDMGNVVEKIRATGNRRVMLTERGASFGYNNLVVDMRSIPTMQRTTHAPVIFDAGHSVQQPGGLGAATGGDRTAIPPLARAAVAAGCDGLFIETHPDPERAKSDGPNSYPLHELPILLGIVAKIAAVIRHPIPR